MKRLDAYIFVLLGMLAGLSSCSTTKHLPEGETLYLGLKNITIQNEDETKAGQTALDEVMGAISIAPNNAIVTYPNVRFPIPFGLWMYNRFERYEKGFGRWIFKHLAADPVLLSEVNPDTRAKVAGNLLRDYGFFDGHVTWKIDSTKNERAVKLSYDIDMGRPYRIDTLLYEGFAPRTDSLIHARSSERLVHTDDYFNVNTLNAERQRVVDLLRNHGYYYARTDFLTFLADTLMRPGYVMLKMVPAANLPKEALKTYHIGKTAVYLTGYNGEPQNFRRMGASLNLELKGSYEWQTSSTVDGDKSVMNSYELGAALSLDFPRIVIPWVRNRIDPFRFPSETHFRIYAEQVNRARYFKMLSFGGSISYSFQKSRSMKHTVTPVHLAFNHLQRRTATFDSIALANPMLFHSLDDQFIPSISYTFTYDDSWRQRRWRIWWENSFTSAGNITSAIYAAFGRGFKEKEKKFLGTPFAQFLKFTSEIRPLFYINEKQQLAGRLMAGVIWAYGNKTIAPYNEQFYVGGANSIRAR